MSGSKAAEEEVINPLGGQRKARVVTPTLGKF
jgi:hypothetical protein